MLRIRGIPRYKRHNGRCTAVTDAKLHFNLFSRRWKLGSLIVAVHCLVHLGFWTLYCLSSPILRPSSPDIHSAPFSCVFTPRYLTCVQNSIRLFSSPTLGFLALLCMLHLRIVVTLVQQSFHYACFKLSSVADCRNILVPCKFLSLRRFATNYRYRNKLQKYLNKFV